jgi:F-type H+-transporting ATPase subunit b
MSTQKNLAIYVETAELPYEETTVGAQEEQTETANTQVHESPIASVVGTFGLRADLFVAQLVNFLLVLLVLWKFAYKPILKALDEREKKIAKSVLDAEQVTKRLQDAEKEKVDILRLAREEADAFARRSLEETQMRKTEMVAAAKQEVERVIAHGKTQLVQEHDAMLVAMRKEIVEIAIAAAAKVVGETMTEKKSQSLAEEIVRKMT